MVMTVVVASSVTVATDSAGAGGGCPDLGDTGAVPDGRSGDPWAPGVTSDR